MSANVIGEAVITVGADASKFSQSVEGQTGAAGKKSGNAFTKKLGGALKLGAVGAGAAVAGILGTSMVKGFSRLDAIDQAKAKLDGLGHTAEGVQTVMDSALASVKGTAYGLGEATGVAANLVAAGIEPGKDLTRTLKLLADTATISGGSMKELGSIFNKVSANGKVTGEVVAQLQDRGVPALKFFADETGTSMKEAQEAVKSGKVDFETFQDAMEKGLGGAALASGKTFKGGLANVQAALGRFGANLLSGVFSKLPNLFADMIGVIDKLAPVAEKIGAALGSAFQFAYDTLSALFNSPAVGGGGLASFGETVSSVFKTVGPVIKEAFETVGPVLKDLLGKVGPVMKELGTLVQGSLEQIGPYLIDVITTLAPVLGKIGALIGTVFEAVGPILAKVGEIILTTILPAVLAFGGYIAEKLAPVLGQIVDVLRNVVEALAPVGMFIVDVLIPAILDVVKSVANSLRPAFEAVVEVFKKDVLPAIDKIVEKFKELWPSIQKVIKFAVTLTGAIAKLAAWIIGKLLPPILKLVGWLISKLVPALLKVVGWVIKFIGWVAELGLKLADGIKAIGRFATAIKEKIGQVTKWFKDLPGVIARKLGDLGSILYQKGKDIVQGLLDGAGSLLKTIGNFFLDKLPGWIKTPFKKALGIGSPSKVFAGMGKNIGQGLINGIEGQVRQVQKATRDISDAAQPKMPKGLRVDLMTGPNMPKAKIRSQTGTVAEGANSSVSKTAIINNYYPKPERASDSVAMQIRRAEYAM